MGTDRSARLLAALVLALAWTLVPAPGGAEVPELLAYQGVLTLPDGKKPQDGPYDLRFEVLDAQDQVVFEEPVTVQVQDGLYNVLLGGAGSGLLSDAFADHPTEMQVTVVSGGGVSNAVMPRQIIAAVPYAFAARRAEAPVAGAAGVPTGMIILWDQATGCSSPPSACPCGWDEVTAFQGLMVRGADTAERWDDIPDGPGDTPPTPGGTGKYEDTLTSSEAPHHTHKSDPVADHVHSLPDVHVAKGWTDDRVKVGGDRYKREFPPTGKGGLHSHTTHSDGQGSPHHHAPRRVLLCRKS